MPPAPRPGGGAPGDGTSAGATASIFTTVSGGLGAVPEAVAAVSGAKVQTGAMVRELARTPAGWRLTVGSAHSPAYLEADAVVLALPAGPASRLLAGVEGAADAQAALAGISYASMAVVTLAYPSAAFPAPLTGSGYLVPAVDGHPVKAVTYSSLKWPHLRSAEPGMIVVRCSIGRIGEEEVLHRDDADLAALAAAGLAGATGVRGRPASHRVTRWGGALPQYTVGHLGRVERIRAGVGRQPGLAGCGAPYDGIGIPACIATARTAADQILAHLCAPRGAAGPARTADGAGLAPGRGWRTGRRRGGTAAPGPRMGSAAAAPPSPHPEKDPQKVPPVRQISAIRIDKGATSRAVAP